MNFQRLLAGARHSATLVLHSAVFLTLSFFVPKLVFANQVTGNQYVGAQVDDQLGLISIYEPPNKTFGPSLTYPEHSYLCVLINGQYYSNNVTFFPQGGNIHYLPNPSALSKSGDTIICIWNNINGVNVIQKCWPVLFELGGQIVMSFSIQNPPGGVPTTCQAQFFLDTDPGGSDHAKILTQWGYSTNWVSFPNQNNPIPWFYANFQYDLPGKNFDLGITGVGVLDDTRLGSPMGLMLPDAVVIGDWTIISQTPWWNAATPNTTYGDSGVLLEWQAMGVPVKRTVEIGRTSYGTKLFALCPGPILALTFYPNPLRYSPIPVPHYIPNDFQIESYLFNSNSTTQATGVAATLTTGPLLTIDSPANAINGKHTETQVLPFSIDPFGVSVVDWMVHADLYTACSGNDTSWFAISGSTTGGKFFKDTCQESIILPGVAIDTQPPIVDKRYVSPDAHHDTVSENIHDDRCSDRGLQSITVTPGTIPPAFKYTQSRGIVPCDTVNTVTIKLVQVDSTVGQCFYFVFTDCANNKSYDTICFSAHPLASHPDVTAPRFLLQSLTDTTDSRMCSAKCQQWQANDSATTLYDTGLQSIGITPSTTPTNMTLSVPSIASGQPLASFTACVTDSMQNGSVSVRATDLKGNFRDTVLTYCTTPDIKAPLIFIQQVNVSPASWMVIVTDTQAWDRGIDSVVISPELPVTGNIDWKPLLSNQRSNFAQFRGTRIDTLYATVHDTSLEASFCVYAVDIAGNKSPQECDKNDTVQDVWPPNIVVKPDPTANPANPASWTVNINDIHYYGPDTAHDRIGRDKGIQMVWFAAHPGLLIEDAVSGTILPDTIQDNCSPQVNLIKVVVQDTTSLQSTACVKINAFDCAHNYSDTTICYDYTSDVNPPRLTGIFANDSVVNLHVTDSLTHDRGLDSVWLDPSINFQSLNKHLNSTQSWDGQLLVASTGQSAYGVLHTLDFWGAQSADPVVRQAHTDTLPVHVWVQNYAMKKGNLFLATNLPANGIIGVPLNFVRNDTFKLARKNITQYQFTFTLAGDPSITYDPLNGYSVALSATPAAPAWSVTVNPVGTNTWTLTAKSNDGSALTLEDTLIHLLFHSAKSISTYQATVSLVDGPTGSVMFNGGAGDTTHGSNNAIAYLPGPSGTLSGTTIVVAGTCAPSVGIDTLPLKTSIDPAHPNPFTSQVKLSYTVATEGIVTLVVYDAMGREVSRLVSQSQKPGYYEAIFNGAGSAPGTYFARLEAGGTVASRAMVLSK